MNLTKKITQILSGIFLVGLLASCDKTCVESEEFDVQSVTIESNPAADGIYGIYNENTGGQIAIWHDTGLKSNGDQFLMQISGTWTRNNGNSMNDDALNALPVCNTCAKKNGVQNCICRKGQTPSPEKSPDGTTPSNVDCSQAANQDDPTKCTCTQQHGLATDYGVYLFPLDILNKDETPKIADLQNNCRYVQGMGAYISLWGNSGNVPPLRLYHLYSEEAICNVPLDSQGRCLDASGNDITRYVIRSRNNRIYMKDDKNGNDGSDTNTSDDVYHGPNEVVKTIMYDVYYSDNYGSYNLTILRGVGDVNETGLLEFLVSLVEDVLLGKIGDDGTRQGGITEFMYKSIIQDSGFVLIVQVCLSLYIVLFGMAHLFGVVEMNGKELMNRALKIGLIMLFVSENSWYFYSQIVVSFFKDSMDYVVSMIMDLTDSNIDQTSMITIAQMDRAVDASNATRFSYVDVIIKNMMSDAVAKKVFGLFFYNLFGFLYIPMIYAIIFYFIYVMLLIASMYLVNVIKIVFVLCFGPLFMIFTLFSQTAGMFKNWVAFLGSRSLEIIILFTVLYFFLNIIDQNFTQMLMYRTCGENVGAGPVELVVFHSYIDRSFVEWMIIFITIAGLIFITQAVVDKVPSLSGSLISISGVKSASGGFGMASGALSAAFGLAKSGASALGGVATTAGRFGVQGLTLAARKSGLSGAWDNMTKSLPTLSPRELWANSIMDDAIKRAQAGASGSGKEKDMNIRATALKDLQSQIYQNPDKMGLLGIDMTRIAERFDQKLVREPLEKFLKDEAKKMKNKSPEDVLLGKDMRNALRKSATKWAEENLSGGSADVEKLLKDSSIRDLVRKESELTSLEAAKRFAGQDDLKNKYLQHLLDNEARRARKDPGILSKAYHWFMPDRVNNPDEMQGKFLRKVDWEEKDLQSDSFFGAKGINPFNRFDRLDKWTLSDQMRANADAEKRKALAELLAQGKGLVASDKKSAKENSHRNFFMDKLRELALANGGGKTLFERTAGSKDEQAYLATLLSNQSKELADKFKDGTIGMEEFLKERDRLRAGMFGTGDLPDLSGATKFDGDLNKLINDNEKASRDTLAELDKMLAEKVGSSGKVMEEINKLPDPKDDPVVVKKQAEFVANKLEVEFGASFADVLIKPVDVGLQSSNILLGANNAKENQVDPAVINIMRINSNQVSGKLKLSKLNLSLKEFELNKLDKSDPGRSDLEREIQELKRNVKDGEAEESRIKSEISRLENLG